MSVTIFFYCTTDSEEDESEDDVDENVDVGSDYESSENEAITEIYPIETRRKIVEYWLNDGGKRRSFKRMQHLYKKLTREDLLWKWRNRLNRSNDYS